MAGKEGMVELMCSSLEHLGEEQLGQKYLRQGHSELGFETRVFAIEQLRLKLIVTDPSCPDKSLDPFSELTDSIKINLLRIEKNTVVKRKKVLASDTLGSRV